MKSFWKTYLISSFPLIVFSCQNGSSNDLESQVKDKEEDYIALINKFESLSVPDYRITVGNFDKNGYFIEFAPDFGNIADTSRTFGEKYVLNNALETYLILAEFNWTKEDIKEIKSLLDKIDKDYIRLNREFQNPIEIYDESNGNTSCSIFVYPESNLEAVKKERGEGIGDSNFLQRVYIHCSGAL